MAKKKSKKKERKVSTKEAEVESQCAKEALLETSDQNDIEPQEDAQNVWDRKSETEHSDSQIEESDNEQDTNEEPDESKEETFDEITEHGDQPKKKKKKIHKLSLTETENFNEKLRRRGVIYLARIPPRMGPAKVKSILGDFGVVTRVYLAEEDKTARKRRQRASGSKGGGGKRYVEGWVEFEDKKIAKRVGAALNNTPITNHKRSVHYGDLWNLKYLRKFQWAHLTEKVAYERRVREQKMRLEMMQARKENQAYSNLVEAGKTMDRIEERRKKRKAKEEAAGKIEGRGSEKQKKHKLNKNDMQHSTRKFRQTAPVDEGNDRAAKSAVLGSLV